MFKRNLKLRSNWNPLKIRAKWKFRERSQIFDSYQWPPDAGDSWYGYVFMRFVMDNLPEGIVDYSSQYFFRQQMSFTSVWAHALWALDTVQVILYKDRSKRWWWSSLYLLSQKYFTAILGVGAILSFENFMHPCLKILIQAVNPPWFINFTERILGIFLWLGFLWNGSRKAVFIAALMSECFDITGHLEMESGIFRIRLGYTASSGICLGLFGLNAFLRLIHPSNNRN